MSQTQPVDITDGTLLLDEATLRSAQIRHKARIIIRDRSILILPESDQSADPVNSTFGLIQLPAAIAKRSLIGRNSNMKFDDLQSGDRLFLDANISLTLLLTTQPSNTAADGKARRFSVIIPNR